MSTDVMIERVVELSEPRNAEAYRRYLVTLAPEILQHRLVILDLENGTDGKRGNYRQRNPRQAKEASR